MAVDYPGDHGTQFYALGEASQVCKDTVAFQHFVFSRAEARLRVATAYLEEMVHHPQAGKFCFVSSRSNFCQFGGDAGRSTRPGKIRNLQSNFHISSFSTKFTRKVVRSAPGQQSIWRAADKHP